MASFQETTPLDRAQGPVRAILFDFDGTLTAPGALDFGEIRERIRCPAGESILEYLDRLPEQEGLRAREILHELELDAASRSLPNHGAQELFEWLLDETIPLGIATRNSRASLERAVEQFPFLAPSDFVEIFPRDEDIPPKPDPEVVRTFAARLNLRPQEILCVGDYLYDIEAANRAQAISVYVGEGASWLEKEPPSFVVSDLRGLAELLPYLLPLQVGKIPNDLLEEILEPLDFSEEYVTVGPGPGEDAAVVPLPPGLSHLILKGDPVTFTAEGVGEVLLAVNENDIATTGGRARWLTLTLFLPPDSMALTARHLIHEVAEEAHRREILLIGGHTEVTDGVTRPLLAAQLTGTLGEEEKLFLKSAARSGDRILLTQSIAIEGTGILARDFKEELEKRGVSPEVLERGAALLSDPGIDVLPQIELLKNEEGVVAFHDVTEGGVLTAAEEFSRATGHAFLLDLEQIPIHEVTREICRSLDVDPLGLLGSGSLLVIARPESSDRLQERLREAQIPAADIGEVAEPGRSIRSKSDSPSLPRFSVDQMGRAQKKLRSPSSEQHSQ